MSLGNDLATIRKEKNLSLEDIFEATKIPVYTLQSIENDSLLKSSTESKTYLRSFVRSYAKALKISDEYIIAGLKSTETGTYDHDLFRLLNPDSSPEEYSLKKDKVEVEAPKANDSESSKADTYQEEIQSNEKKVFQEQRDRQKSSQPTVATVNWADMSKKVYASPANSKIGLLLIIFLLVVGLGATGYFYGGDIMSMLSSDSSSGQAATIENPANTPDDSFTAIDDSTFTSSDENLTENEPPNTSFSLPETLTVALYAAYDKLEPVRVTSDFNNRTNPFWMNQGEAYYFDFNDTLRVRGQYSRFLWMFNGNVINNPRQNHYDPTTGSIVITRAILSAPEYQQNNENNFPTNLGVAAPDSIIYRLEF